MDPNTEATTSTTKNIVILTFQREGQTFQAVSNGKIERNPAPSSMRYMAENQGYKVPAISHEAERVALSKSRMEKTVKVTLQPGRKDYHKGTFAPHIAILMDLDQLQACGALAAGHM